MAGAISLTGDDTIIVNGRVLTNLADGNCVELTFPNDIANVKIGKNGNALFGLNTTGQMSEQKIRIIRGSSDDQYMLALLNAQQLNFPGTTLLTGQYVKQSGDGKGAIIADTYNMSGGIFAKIPEAKTNVEGDTDQSVAVYTIKSANSQTVRAIT